MFWKQNEIFTSKMRETVYEMYLQGCCVYYFIANLPPKGAIRFIQQDRMARQKVKSAVEQKIIASKDTVQTQYPETVIALDKVKSSASKMSAEMSGAKKTRQMHETSQRVPLKTSNR